MTRLPLTLLFASLVACVPDAPEKAPAATDSIVEEDSRPVRAGAGPKSLTAPECVPDAARALHHEAEGSFHELVTCGGLQQNTAATLPLRIVLSADDIEPETVAFVEETIGTPPLTQSKGGTWWVDMERGRFEVSFAEPDGTEIEADPFRFESYLSGVRIEQDHTFAEMLRDPDLENTWRFHYDEPGPLAHLLTPRSVMWRKESELPNPIVVRASMADLSSVLYGGGELPDLGAFNGLRKILLESRLLFEDRRASATITYEATTRPVSLADLAVGSGETLQVRDMAAASSQVTAGIALESLRYVPAGVAGRVEYTFETPDGIVHAISDYRSGAAYPEVSWRCDDRSPPR